MRGRKKTPAKILQLRGNPGRRPINDAEPKCESGIPKKPKFLSDSARKYWAYHARRLDRAGVLAKVDLGILWGYVSALATLERAEKELAEHGYTQVTENGEKKSPWIMIAKESRDQLRSLGSELGVTPASRARIKVDAKRELNPFEAYKARRGA